MENEFTLFMIEKQKEYERLECFREHICNVYHSGKIILELDIRDDLYARVNKALKACMDESPLAHMLTDDVVFEYYRQFRYVQFAMECRDKYLMIIEGNNIPCLEYPYVDLSSGRFYLDYILENKVSYNTGHIFIDTDIFRRLLDHVCSGAPDDRIGVFIEKVVDSIKPEHVPEVAFSLSELYGAYVATHCTDSFISRRWKVFWHGGAFFDLRAIMESDFKWLGKEYSSICFSRNEIANEDNLKLFANPYYQEKLTPTQIEAAINLDEIVGIDYGNVNIETVYSNSNGNMLFQMEKNNHVDEKKVLIVIVSYNICFFLKKNIDQIRKTLRPGSYKIIVVDNASSDESPNYLREQKDILYILNEENLGFGPACNQAVRATKRTEYENYDVFLLNNDAMLTDNTISVMKCALFSHDDIGAVGAYSNAAGNHQQIDIEFDDLNRYLEYGRSLPISFDCVEERVRLSAFAMLIRRNVYELVGGFDEDFVPGYFEDDQLSMEIAKKGFRLLMVNSAFVYHAGSTSFRKTNYLDIQRKNHRLFIEKYGFNILEWAYADDLMLSKIPQSLGGYFSVIEYGTGLGADLKAIRTLFPDARIYGIESNRAIRGVSGATETVYENALDALNALGENYFDLMIINKAKQNEITVPDREALEKMIKEDASILYSNTDYVDFPFDEIKLVIWDMDETFWQGTISEGDVVIPQQNLDIIVSLNNHGIINSISSRNDEEVVIEKLKESGIKDYFVFNDINWEDKGEQIAAKITAMGLRPENTLFIDDNPRNLAEAAMCAKGIMIALPDIIPYMARFLNRTAPKETDAKRLEKYKVLEEKERARAKCTSKEEFLMNSDIRIKIITDTANAIDRIEEMVLRTNQLNYTKLRSKKEVILDQIKDSRYCSGYIEASDKYGDYGIVGFYCLDRNENRLIHFLFSCRILGMGIEQYMYNKLGCPSIDIVPPVSSELSENASITWIREEGEKVNTEKAVDGRKMQVLFKGPCDLLSIEAYINGGEIINEFNFVNDRGFITAGHNHSMNIWQNKHLTKDEIAEIVQEVPFVGFEDFETSIFTKEYDVICYSLLPDYCSALYKKKNAERYINFASANFNLTDPKFENRFISGEIQNHGFPFTKEIIDEFRDNWEYIGSTPPDILFRNLDYIYDNVKGRPLIILILGSEIDYECDNEEFGGFGELYRLMNPMIEEFALDHDRVITVNPTDFIRSQEDFEDCINHYSRNVYYEMAGEICRLINKKADG